MKALTALWILGVAAILLIFPHMSLLDKIEARITGPFHFRLIIQPVVAIIVGILHGRADVKSGERPFAFKLLSDKKNLKPNLIKAVKTIKIPLLLGVGLDLIAQFLLFDRIRIWGALVVGILIVFLPYALSRGISNRIGTQRNPSSTES